MNLDELDQLAAIHVMGWDERDQELYKIMNDRHWQPTRNISQAWKCLEKLNDIHLSIYREYDDDGEEYFTVHIKACGAEVLAETAPLAITLAALKAVGVEIETFRD